jgi:SSS family solute:Na+ symporter
LNVFTLGEWLEKRYSAPVGISYSIIWSLVWMLVNLGLYLYGGAFVLESLVGWDLYTSIVVLSIIAAFYTLIGGFGAVVATDVLQISLMFFPFVFLSWAVWQDVGGLSQLAARLPEAKGIFWTGDTPLGPLYIFILGSFFMGTSYWSCEAQVIQRPLSTQNEEDATLSFLGTTFWLAILAPFLISIPVLAAISYFPDLPNNDLAMPSMIRKFLPHGLYGVTIVGLMAGVFSSADSQINAFSTMFTRDIYSRLIRPGRTETHYLKASKVSGAIFTFAAIGTAMLFTKAEHGMMIFALSILVTIMPPFAAITVFGALSRRINPTGALVGLVHGGVIAITLVILSITGALAFFADVDMILRAAVTFIYTAAVAWVASKHVREAGSADAPATGDDTYEAQGDEVDISLNLTPRVIRMMVVLLLGLASVTALWSYYFRAH